MSRCTTRGLKAFLSNREQCVRVGISKSSWKKTNGGLPQGTKLGPLLFAVLINSLLTDWPGRIKFVDDTSALEIIPRYSPSLMPLVVNDISAFASARGMELNHKKCKQMVISFLKYKGSDKNQIFVAGNPVEIVSSFKLLGVWISNDLSWNTHVDMVLKKANSRLYALRLLKKALVFFQQILLKSMSPSLDLELNMHPQSGRHYLNHYLTFSNQSKREL